MTIHSSASVKTSAHLARMIAMISDGVLTIGGPE
jgi:hypothetical protein